MRGYYGIGVYHPKKEVNIGTLWRSAYSFGAAFLFTIGRRYEHQSSNTTRSERHLPLHHYGTFEDFLEHRPHGARLIGVEQAEGASDIDGFCHPSQALYLLGAEDHGLPPEILERCNIVLSIDTERSLNVAVAGSIVMYSRRLSRERPWHSLQVARIEKGKTCDATCRHEPVAAAD